jgi:glycosyltransferase involved in cell wall biosynthesis
MNKSMVSVVIPSFNRSEIISETIESVLHQGRVDQIIVVDDFSKEPYSNLSCLKNKKITLIRNSSNLGESTSVNIGLSKVKNDYAMVLSDDDPQFHNFFDDLLLFVDANPNYGVYVPSYSSGASHKDLHRTVLAQQYGSADIIGLLICPAGPGALLNMKRIVDRQIRDDDKNTPSDLIQWMNLALVVDFKAVPNVLAFWRTSEYQYSNKLFTNIGLNEYAVSILTWLGVNPIKHPERTYLSLCLRLAQIHKQIPDDKKSLFRILLIVLKAAKNDSNTITLKVVPAAIWVIVRICGIKLVRGTKILKKRMERK